MKYAVERFTEDVIDELKRLVTAHWEEVGPFQFEFIIDWDKYRSFDAIDAVVLITARVDKDMVGYAIYLVDTHTHFATTVFAAQDALYIAPEHRGNGAGKGLLDFSEESLASGCDAIIQGVLPTLDFSDLLVAQGYKPMENLYVKTLTRTH